MLARRSLVAAAAVVLLMPAARTRADDAVKITSCMTITASGSYALAKNVVAEPKTLQPLGEGTPTRYACVRIEADFVTLDLAGFSLIGDATPEVYGIAVTGRRGVVVRNGTITGFSFSGLSIAFGRENTAENLRVLSNGRSGITMSGTPNAGTRGAVVRNCTVAANGGVGISVSQQASIVTGNIATDNATGGISVSCPALVAGNVAYMNGAGGSEQIRVSRGSYYGTELACTETDNTDAQLPY